MPGERVFHNPYRTAERRPPVAAAVADLWTRRALTQQQQAARQAAQELEARSASRAATPAPAQTAEAARGTQTLGLFQDIKPDVRSLFTAGVRG